MLTIVGGSCYLLENSKQKGLNNMMQNLYGYFTLISWLLFMICKSNLEDTFRKSNYHNDVKFHISKISVSRDDVSPTTSSNSEISCNMLISSANGSAKCLDTNSEWDNVLLSLTDLTRWLSLFYKRSGWMVKHYFINSEAWGEILMKQFFE